MDIDEFLSDIGPSFIRFSSNLKDEGFTNTNTLKCIELPGDLDLILKDEKVNLAEKRQLQCALRNLKSDSSTEVKDSVISDICVSTGQSDRANPLDKIMDKNKTGLKKKKEEIFELEKLLKKLNKPVQEPMPCGSRSVRCSNCHVLGHKAEGNYGGKSCPNAPCTNYFRCGQDKFHPDYKLEKKTT